MGLRNAVPAAAKGRPAPAAVALRPLGYLFMGVVWAAIWLCAVLVAPGAIVYNYMEPGATYDAVLGSNSVLEWIGVAIIVPVGAAALGSGVFYLTTMAWPLAVLSAVYVGRSLRPSFARERLSGTVWVGAGETLGPTTAGLVAMSLLPVRRTRVTDVLMVWYEAGWEPEKDTFLAAWPAGLGWSIFLVWTMGGLSVGTRWVLAAVGTALYLVSAVLLWRVMRQRFRAGQR